MRHSLLTRLVALILVFSLLMPSTAMAGWKISMPKLPNPVKVVKQIAKAAVKRVVQSRVAKAVTRYACASKPVACALTRAAVTGLRKGVKALQRNFKPQEWVRKAVKKTRAVQAEVRKKRLAAGKRLRKGWDRNFEIHRSAVKIGWRLKWKYWTTAASCVSVVPGWGWAVGATNELAFKPLVSTISEDPNAEVGNIYEDVYHAARGTTHDKHSRREGTKANAGNIVGVGKWIADKKAASDARRVNSTMRAFNRLRVPTPASVAKMSRALRLASASAKFARVAGPAASVYGAVECGKGAWNLSKDIVKEGRRERDAYRRKFRKAQPPPSSLQRGYQKPVRTRRAGPPRKSAGAPAGGAPRTTSSVKPAAVPGGSIR